MPSAAPATRRPSPYFVVAALERRDEPTHDAAAIADIVADALALLDAATICDPETEPGSGSCAPPSDEEELAASNGGR